MRKIVKKKVVRNERLDCLTEMGFTLGKDGKWAQMATLDRALILGHGTVGIGRLGIFGKGPSALGFYRIKKRKLGSFSPSALDGPFLSAIQFDDSKAIDVLIGQLTDLKAVYKNSDVSYGCFDEIALAS